MESNEVEGTFRKYVLAILIFLSTSSLVAVGKIYHDMYGAGGRVDEAEIEGCPEPCVEKIDQVSEQVQSIDSKLNRILSAVLEDEKGDTHGYINDPYNVDRYRYTRGFSDTRTPWRYRQKDRDLGRPTGDRFGIDPLYDPKRIRKPVEGG